MCDRRRHRRRAGRGSVTLEAVAVLPFVMLVVAGVLQVVGVARDVLLAHEAARAGMRVAVTTAGTAPAAAAARRAAGPLPVDVSVEPPERTPGELVRVTVEAPVRLGPVRRTVSTVAVGVAEPALGTP